ncbi:MAG: GTPase HflX [Deltaproteobacteria bacterium]|nr:GTPase HflX [Deltaproteobacteria bacterium]
MVGTRMEKAVLVGIYQKNREQCVSSLKELAFLVQTAGGEAEVTFIQHLDKIHPGTFIGKGKVAEIKEYLSAHKIDLVVFDDSLSPAQQSNLEDELEVTVLDRTAVILDIFAQNARTKEGALQVELAQLQYRLPRLKGSKQHLSRLGGGIGTRGPGETQLEVDRRRIRQRIDGICAELGRVKQHRKLHREKRRGVPLPVVALVGYTNAGKSTLLNTLCEANVVSAANRLFETLDPTTRRIELSNRQPVLITDTVGFIQKLPHELVESFKATLEEIGESDLILHIIDGSHPEFEKQAQTKASSDCITSS